MRYALLIFAFSCGDRPSVTEVGCTTRFGMRIAGPGGAIAYSCEEYGAVEELLASKTSLPVWNAVNGAMTIELPGDDSLGSDGRRLSGWAQCDYRLINVHNKDGTAHVWQTAYAHEVMHLAQGCWSPPPVDPGKDEAHANWVRDGIDLAIETTNLELTGRFP